MAIEYSIAPAQDRAIDAALETLWSAALTFDTGEGYLTRRRHHFIEAKKSIIQALIIGGRIGKGQVVIEELP